MREDFEFFWHGDRGYNNCEYGQWYIRDTIMNIASAVEDLPFLQKWLDESRPSSFKVNCAEQWMMFCKAILMGDCKTANEILKMSSPRDHKKAGRQIKDFNEELWNVWKLPIVVYGNLIKFSQHKDLNAKILSVPLTKKFVEASPLDKIWGIGRAEDDPLAWEEKTWNGQNLLGKALDQVRKLLG